MKDICNRYVIRSICLGTLLSLNVIHLVNSIVFITLYEIRIFLM